MRSSRTQSRGRPSLENADREKLLWMLELWQAGKSGLSARKISRVVVGLEVIPPDKEPKISLNDDAKAEKPKPSSIAKRLERRFRELSTKGDALPLSVYQVRNMHLLLLRGGPDQPISLDMHMGATRRTACSLDMSEEEVIEQAHHGWEILSEWFPDTYYRPVPR